MLAYHKMANMLPARQRNVRLFKDRRQPSNDFCYRTQFRFDEVSVVWMADHFLGPDTNEHRGGALSNKKKFEIALRYFSDPGFQAGVSEVVGVSQPSVSRSNKYVIEQIFNKRATWIRFPSTTAEFDDAAQLWQTFKRFPMCFGAVDGTLIPVQLPPYNYNPNQFYSGRKKFHCMNVQVICNAKYEITHVDANWPGSVHDARIWRNSDPLNNLMTGISGDKLLIGDSAYPLSPYLMKPYSQADAAQDPVKRNFNNILSEERVIIENVFGQITSRFQMLRTPIRIDIEMVPKFIIACCVLHNVGKYLDDNWRDDETDEKDDVGDYDPDVVSDPSQVPSSAAAIRTAGQTRREEIASTIAGYVPNRVLRQMN